MAVGDAPIARVATGCLIIITNFAFIKGGVNYNNKIISHLKIYLEGKFL
jgi:hypothetical protein